MGSVGRVVNVASSELKCQGCVYSKAPGQHQQDLNGTRDNDVEATTHARDVSHH